MKCRSFLAMLGLGPAVAVSSAPAAEPTLEHARNVVAAHVDVNRLERAAMAEVARAMEAAQQVPFVVENGNLYIASTPPIRVQQLVATSVSVDSRMVTEARIFDPRSVDQA